MAVAIVIVCFLIPITAYAQNEATGELRDALESGKKSIDTSLWQEYFTNLPEASKQFFGEGEIDSVINDLINGTVNDNSNIFSSLLSNVVDAVKKSAASMIAVMCVALLSGMFSAISDGAGGTGLKDITSFACFSLGAGVIAYTLTQLISVAYESISHLSSFIEIITPIAVTVLAAAGNTATTGIVNPIMSFLTGTVTQVFNTVVLPLTALAAGSAAASCMMESIKLDKLFAFVKSTLKWIIGAVFTIYIGTVSVRGLSAGILDSVTLRAAKYTLDKSVPIIGGALSGTLDSVLGSAHILKSAVGIAGVLTIVAACAAPLLRICAVCFSSRLMAAICEPFSDSRIPKLLSAQADICNYLFSSVCAVALMSIIALGVITAAGGL